MSLSKNVAFMGKFYVHMLKTLPIQTKTVTSASLTYLANLITQKFLEKQPRMDQKRALKFVAFAIILTPISHFWYKFLDDLFKKDEKKKKEETESGKPSQAMVDSSAVKKLLLDELVYDPLCLILFFTVIGLMEGKSALEIAMKIRQDWWPTQKMSWRVWPLVQLINFMVIPGQFRILFMNLIAFFWGIFLQLKAA